MSETNESKANRSRSRSPVAGSAKVKDEKERRSDDDSRRTARRRSRHEVEDPRFRAPSDRRVYVANLQYDTKWQDLKDVFREVVGDCEYVHLFEDEQGKPRGCGIVEFKEKDSVQKALDKMHKYSWKGRNIVVKEDHDVERDATGRIVRGNRSSNRDSHRDGNRDSSRDMSRRSGGNNSGRYGGFEGHGGMDNDVSSPNTYGNTFGLSPQFLDSLNIKGPLTNRIFVANLDFRVNVKKLREVFQLAGHIVDCHLNVDKDGKSRGHGVIIFDHPLEAVQAISMLNGQMLLDRGMIVKMDRHEEPAVNTRKLPSGLKNVGIGLGNGGKPLDIHETNYIRDVDNGSLATSLNRSSGNEMFARGDSFGNDFPNGNRGGAGLLGDGAIAGNRSLSFYMGNGGGGGGVDRPGPAVPNLGYNSVSSTGGMMAGQFDNNMGRNFGNGRRGDSNMMGGGSGGGGGGVGVSGGNGNSGMKVGGSFGGGLGLLGNFGGSTGSQMGVGMGERNNERFDDYRRDFGRRDFSPLRSLGDDFRNPMDENRTHFQDGNPSTVFIHNLSHTCTPKILRDRFSDIGIVKYARISAHGVGIVCFANDVEAERAITMFDGSRLEGRTIEVSYN